MADDIFGKLNSGFTRLGKQVRAGAKELHHGLKQTAGIGVGTLQVSLERFDFRPGELIAGSVKLGLTEPMDAERLVVKLVGTRERISYEKNATGKQTQTKHVEQVCDIERELDGSRSYLDESYSFEIAIPSDLDIPDRAADDGAMDNIARVARVARAVQSAVTSAHHMPAAWRVEATLDVPWKRNVTKKVDITVRE